MSIKTLYPSKENDFMCATQLKLHERMNKKQILSDCDVMMEEMENIAWKVVTKCMESCGKVVLNKKLVPEMILNDW